MLVILDRSSQSTSLSEILRKSPNRVHYDATPSTPLEQMKRKGKKKKKHLPIVNEERDSQNGRGKGGAESFSLKTPSSTAAVRWGSPAECPSTPGLLVIRSRISGTPGTRPVCGSYSTSGTTSACSGRTCAARGPRMRTCRWTWWSFATDLRTREDMDRF